MIIIDKPKEIESILVDLTDVCGYNASPEHLEAFKQAKSKLLGLFSKEKDAIKEDILNMREGAGCSCHISPPCSFCTDENNCIIREVAENI